MALEFRDYKSVYTPMGVETAKLLRERFDENKANIDLVERALGSAQTSEGDRVNVNLLTQKINDMLKNVHESGAYERAGSVAADAVTLMQTDKGYNLAKQSYLNRQKEIEWNKEFVAKNPGARVLDPREFDNHVSYYIDENGNEVENLYQSSTQIEADYPTYMKQLISNVKADWWGITEERANQIAKDLTNTYLESSIGAQDEWRLMKIDLADVPEEQRQQAAYNNILERMQSFTNQIIHETESSRLINQGIAAGNTGSTAIRDITLPESPGTKQTSFEKNWGLSQGKLFDLNKEFIKTRDDKVLRDTQILMIGKAQKAVQDGHITQAEYDQWYHYNIGQWNTGEEEFAGLTNEWTMNPNYGRLVNLMNPQGFGKHGVDEKLFGMETSVGGSDVASGAVGVGVGTGVLGSVFGTNWWNPAGWIAGAGLAVLGIDAFGKKLADNFGNVRDVQRPQGDLSVYGFGNEAEPGYEGTRGQSWDSFAWWKSEVNTLFDNYQKIDRINNLLDKEYDANSKEYKDLVKKGMGSYAWRVKGGDDIEKRINQTEGTALNTNVFAPSASNKEARDMINAIETDMQITDFDILGAPDDSKYWEEYLKKDGKIGNIGDAKIKVLGITTPSISDRIPMYVYMNINGNPVLAKPKISSYGGINRADELAAAMGRTDLIVLDRARMQIENFEDNLPRGQYATGHHLHKTLVDIYTQMGDPKAQYSAYKILYDIFRTGNPELYAILNQEAQLRKEKLAADGQVFNELKYWTDAMTSHDFGFANGGSWLDQKIMR